LLTPPLAALMLKERMEPRSVAAGMVGFAGVLVAVGTAVAYCVVRLLKRCGKP